MFRIAMACCLAILASAHAASAQMLQRPVTAPQDYRQLAANAAATGMRDIAAAGLEISELRPTHAPQLDDWYACMRGADGQGAFAVFFRDGAVTTMRRAVVIDHCAAAAYGPMPKGRVLKEGEKDSGSEDAPRDAKKRAKPRP